MNLPEILAGPILRLVDPSRVVVWLATSTPMEVDVEVGRIADDLPSGLEVLGEATARSVRFGEALWVHLADVRPADGTFPVGRLLAYDLALGRPPRTDGPQRRLADVRRVTGDHRITYGHFTLPTFFIQDPEAPLRILHGSCRLLHGHGEDAFLAADELIEDTATDLSRRPSALFLTGDQIYGDEVAGPLIRHLTALGAAVIGGHDDTSVPGIASLAELPVYGRTDACLETARFTSSKPLNHLFSLGEYVAAYLVAWDEANWPDHVPAAEDAVPDDERTPKGTRRLRRQYETEAAALEAARRAIPAVRRVLANTPTYMCFDDHDVTDDWNLTREWRDGVKNSPTGRRVVANALGSFWAFQGWGNQPDVFDDDFIAGVTSGAVDAKAGLDDFENTLWSFDRWSFIAPTHPPTVVLDTRTQRTHDSEQGAPRLMSLAELGRVRSLCRAAGVRGPGPVVFVSAVPVFGLELQERRQKFLAGKVGPYEIDLEAWHSNLQGLVELMQFLICELHLSRTVLLSGDVHYGLNVEAEFGVNAQQMAIIQIVSSSFKHSGSLARTALNVLGALARAEHERVGWDAPPSVKEATGAFRLVRHLLQRPVNTDEWHDDSPVFLNGKLADRVEADVDPPYWERRAYVSPEERPRFSVIGENNIGYLALDEDGVVHRHLVALGDEDLRTYTARLSWPQSREPDEATRE